MHADRGPSVTPRPRIDVVGAVLVADDGCVMAARRGERMSSPGLWEFPGGKIEPGETPQQALEREIREELDCPIDVHGRVTTTEYRGNPDHIIVLTTFYARTRLGRTPRALEHSELRWMPASGLDRLTWAPADIPAVRRVMRQRG